MTNLTFSHFKNIQHCIVRNNWLNNKINLKKCLFKFLKCDFPEKILFDSMFTFCKLKASLNKISLSLSYVWYNTFTYQARQRPSHFFVFLFDSFTSMNVAYTKHIGQAYALLPLLLPSSRFCCFSLIRSCGDVAAVGTATDWCFDTL